MSRPLDGQRIGIIGLGKMGSAMARRLSGAGFAVSGWTRRGVDDELAATLGVTGFTDMSELIGQSDVVMTSLFNDAAVEAVLGLIVGADLGGKLIVETSTVSSDILRGKLAAIRAAGGGAIDAPISGGPELIARGEAGLYIGGDKADFERFGPIAETLSNRIVHVGPVGSGSGAAAKIVNNMMLAGQWETLKEALQVGKRAGLDLDTMMAVLLDSPSATAAMRGRAEIILGASTRVGFPVSGVIKDASLFVATAERLGVATPAVSAALESYREALAAGHGEEDLAMMVRKGFLDA